MRPISSAPQRRRCGRPWKMVEGKGNPDSKRSLSIAGLPGEPGWELATKAKSVGRGIHNIVGLSDGTAAITASVAFCFEKGLGAFTANVNAVSFVLAKVKPGESPQAIAAEIESQVPQVTAQTRPMLQPRSGRWSKT